MSLGHGSRIPRLRARAILSVGTAAPTFTFAGLCAPLSLTLALTVTLAGPSHTSDEWQHASPAEVLPALGSGPVGSGFSGWIRMLTIAAALAGITLLGGIAVLVVWRRHRRQLIGSS